MRVLVQDVPDKPHAQAGQVLDLPEDEAKDMIRRGAAIAAPDELPAPPVEPTAPVGAVDIETDEPDPVVEQPSPSPAPGAVRHAVKKPAHPRKR